MQTQQTLDPLSQPRRSSAVRLMMDGSSRWVHGDDLDPGPSGVRLALMNTP